MVIGTDAGAAVRYLPDEVCMPVEVEREIQVQVCRMVEQPAQ